MAVGALGAGNSSDGTGGVLGGQFEGMAFGTGHVAGDARAGSAGIVGVCHADVLVIAGGIVRLTGKLIAGFIEDGGTGCQVMGVDEAAYAIGVNVVGYILAYFTTEMTTHADVGLIHVRIGNSCRRGSCGCSCVDLGNGTRIAQSTGLGIAMAAPAIEQFILR